MVVRQKRNNKWVDGGHVYPEDPNGYNEGELMYFHSKKTSRGVEVCSADVPDDNDRADLTEELSPSSTKGEMEQVIQQITPELIREQQDPDLKDINKGLNEGMANPDYIMQKGR